MSEPSRIVRTSNFDEEMYTEEFVNVPVMPKEKAWEVCHILNSIDPNGPHYYQPKPLNYVLYKFEP